MVQSVRPSRQGECSAASCTLPPPSTSQASSATADGRQVLVGEPDNRPTPRLARLADWLRRADFDSRESPNIQHDIWFKLWGNLSMNPISLLTSATSDRIIDEPLVRRLCVSMMEEAARIGAALGMQASTPVSTSIEKMIGMIRALGSFKMSTDLSEATTSDLSP